MPSLHPLRSAALRVSASGLFAALAALSLAAPGDLLFTLNNPTPQEGDQFGASDRAMTGNGEEIFIGDPSDDAAGENSGAVHAFNGHTWAYLRTILDPAARPGDAFGSSLAITPDGTLVVGAPLDDTQSTDSGKVYVFSAGAVHPARVLQDPFPNDGHLFGQTVDTAGGRIAVAGIGAFGDNRVFERGVYTFSLETGAFLHRVECQYSPRIALTDKYLAAFLYGTPRFYDAATGQHISTGSRQGFNLARCGENFISGPGAGTEGTPTVMDGSTGLALTFYSSSWGASVTSLAGNPAFTSSRSSGGTSPTWSTTANVLDEWNKLQFTVNGAGSEPRFLASAGNRLLLASPATTETVLVYEGPPPAEVPLAPNSISARRTAGGYYQPGQFSYDDAASITWRPRQASIAGYLIERRDGSGGYRTIAPVGGRSSSYTDINLPSHTEENAHTDLLISYRVRALNLAYASGPSPEAVVALPAVPSNLLATAVGSAVNLQWTDQSSYEEGYSLERGTPNSNFAVLAELPPNATSYTDTTVVPNLAYRYRIRAKRESLYTGYSNVADVVLVAPVPHLLKTISSPEPSAGVGFGTSIASGDGMLVVGAPGADGLGGVQDAGRVYVFDAATGALRIALDSPNPSPFARFGFSVTVTRGNILVGAPGANGGVAGSGAAYLYSGKSGWHLTMLTSPSPAVGELFGASVGSVQDNLVIGAPGTGWSTGAVYITDPRRKQLRTLVNPTASYSDSFGWAVAAWEDHVMVTAPGDDIGKPDAGTACRFDWRHNTVLSQSPLAFSVAPIRDGSGRFLIGVMSGSSPTAPQVAYAYEVGKDSDQPVMAYANPAPQLGDEFGYSVASSSSLVAVGAPGASGNFSDTGWVWVFNRNDGGVNRRFNNPTPGTGDRFGHSLCDLPDGNFAVGAPGDDSGADGAGSVSIFSAQP